MIILAIIVPLLLGGGGLYCLIQGKFVNDNSTLFYAGIGLLAITLLAAGLAYVYIARRSQYGYGCCCHLFPSLGRGRAPAEAES